MRAGQLRHRLKIQTDSGAGSYGSRGQVTTSWATTDTVWGSVETLNGKEAELARQVYPSATLRVTIRHSTKLTVKKRFQFGTRNLNIGHIDNTDQRNIQQVCLCSEEI